MRLTLGIKKVSALILALVVGATLIACTTQEKAPEVKNDAPQAEQTQPAQKEGGYRIAVVPKLTGIAWFNRMEQGVKKYASETGVDAFYVGPSKGDAVMQMQVIEDLIAQQVDAICVVPFSTEALEPVLKKAREAGIIVIAHEAAGMVNIDYDIEAFDNKAYGEHFIDQLAALNDKKGEYVTFVGGLTSKSHNEWVDSAIAYQEANFPEMKHVGGKNETADDQTQAYEKMKELLKVHPNIAGVQGSAMTDVAGVALAVEEVGKQGQIKIVGTGLVSVSGKYLESGTINSVSFWDPADAGAAMIKLAEKLLAKEEIKDGLNLEIPGYENLKLDGNVFYGQAWVDATKENMSKYDF